MPDSRRNRVIRSWGSRSLAWRLLTTGATVLTLGIGLAYPAWAATLTVTDFGDTGDPGQLRTLVNAAAPGDTIVIPPGIITLSLTLDEDANTTGDIDIRKDLTIRGVDADRTSIVVSGGERVFDVYAPATVTISNMTIRGGLGSGGGGGIRNSGALTLTDVMVGDNRAFNPGPAEMEVIGGGILNAGSAILINCTVSNNVIDFGSGAGIGNTGTMILTNVMVTGNTTGNTGRGGGIANSGTMTLANVMVHGNTASIGGGIFNGGREQTFNGGVIVITPISGTLSLTGGNVSNNAGGGIFNFAGAATLNNVTISDNSAVSGIRNGDTMALTNVTVSGNTSSGDSGFGGGILNIGTLALTNVTVSGNIADLSGGGIANLVVGTGSQGGGVLFSPGTVMLTNVTVTGNTPGGLVGFNNSSTQFKNTIMAHNNSGGNCSGDPSTITSLGHNLDSDTSCGFSGPGDLSGIGPLLDPLQNHGGPTHTHALLPGSPAIDAGTIAGCPTTDQRGIPRPQGSTCDIGATEFGLPTAGVDLNGSAFHTPQTITYQATLIPGFAPSQVDIYLGALMPDGVTFLSLVRGVSDVISMTFGPVPIPFLANVALTQTAVPFSYSFVGNEAVGTYFTYAGLAIAGSDPLQPANQLGLAIQAFQFIP